MSRLLCALFLLLASPLLLAQASPWVEGQHYQRLGTPQASAGQGVEVLEFFKYTCPACAVLEPKLAKWKAGKAADVRFEAIHVAWNPSAEAFARGYYAAEALGLREDTHAAMFRAIHDEKTAFAKVEDIANWYGLRGADRDKFKETMTSFAVNTKIQRAQSMLPRYAVSGTPTIVVGGLYTADAISAGGYDQLLQLTDYLIEKVRKEGGN